ncbi:P-loop containing nucleoside triphosphate hydrolase protein [Usnea florida]
MIDYGTSSRAYRPDIRDEINGPEDQVDRLNVLDLDPAEKLLYCPAKVLAFSLRDKTWKFVKISELQDVTFREDSFKKLVIKAKHKTVVKAMVRSYLSKEPTFGDLIQGKGRGLVVLLHGAPGTGKTLTAECVAEKENRPLYMVTCGDLGTEPDVLERKLQETFEFAVNWNAVLLLDEADVFLQERDVHDLKRNALSFFWTTNRPGSLDEAFQSRIHITLGLPELHAESQMKVWAIFVKELEIGEEEKKAILKHVSEDIKKNGNLNGRQIRNAVRTAIAIAAQKKEQVSEQHVKDVLSIGRDFKVYLEQVNRMNQEQRAAAIGTRVPVKD